jgi:ferredoxin
MDDRIRIRIDGDTCKACGLCVEVCPNRIMKKDGHGIVFRLERLSSCIGCGQCMAACPTRSIVVEGLDYSEDFFPLSDDPTDRKPFLDMIKTRRSIRTFKDSPVPHDLLEKIVEAITFAPPGFTPLKTELVVVQDTAAIRKALPEMIKLYDGLVKAMGNPIGRFFVRLKSGRAKFGTLVNHVVPMMKNRLPDLKAGNEDTITRNGPAMILFHASRDAENYEADLNIALTYGLLAAHDLGLGACALTLLTNAVENSPALRAMFSIPRNNVVVASMVLGHPRYRYQRGIKRSLRNVTWI